MNKNYLIGAGALVAAAAIYGSQQSAKDPQPPIPCGPGQTANCVQPINNGGSTGGVSGSSGQVSNNWTKFAVVDENGFGQPMTAATIDIPPGWRAQGNMRWTGNTCDTENPARYVRLTSANGQTMDWLPGLIFMTALSIQPTALCQNGTITSGEQMVREVLAPRLLQGWTIESIQQKQIPPGLQQLAQAQNGQPYVLDTVLTSPDGQGAVIQVWGMVNQMNHGVQGMPQLVSNLVQQVTLLRGPRDTLPQLVQLAEKVGASTQWDPEWQRRMHEHKMALIRGGRPVARPGSNTSPYNPATPGTPGPRENFPGERSGDIRQKDTIRGIREVEVCVDPDTGERYEVSIHIGCR